MKSPFISEMERYWPMVAREH